MGANPHYNYFNILGVACIATPEQFTKGMNWYPQCHDTLTELSRRSDIDTTHIGAVFSALSPNNKIDRNHADAERMCMAYASGDEDWRETTVCTYNPNRDKAVKIIEERHLSGVDDLLAILNGQKTRSYFLCCLEMFDHPEAVCIDGHAKNIYYGQRHGLTSDKSNIGKLEYKTISKAYREAADAFSELRHETVTASQLQAITWTVWRDIHGIH